MPTLFLLRHAKSSWDDPTVPDHERPLAPRGVRGAKQIAEHLSSGGIRPELVLCSSARRTRETLALVRAALGTRVDVRIDDGLYEADASRLIDRLRRVESQADSVMLVGHNPGLQDLAALLAGGGDEDAMTQLHRKFPTAALATLDTGPTAWDELGPRCASLRSLVTPKRLGRARA